MQVTYINLAVKYLENEKNTLGLFISLDGYSPECTETSSSIVKSMILWMARFNDGV